MIFISKQSRAWLRGTSILPLMCLGGQMVARAAPPVWWSTGSTPVLNTNASNNAGPANVGQAKWMAKSALAAIQSQDAALAALIEADLVGTGKPLASWAAPVTQAEKDGQKAPLLVGQLKAMTAPFYTQINARVPAWLAAERAANQTETNDGIYPWTQWVGDDLNGAVATVGALKAAFSLHVTDDADADGVADFKEWLKFGNADGNDYDGDGVSNLDEIANATNPQDPTVATTGGLPNDWLSFNTNKVAVWPPLAQKNLAVNGTATQAYTVRNDTNAAVTYTAVLSSNTVDTYTDTGLTTMSDWVAIKGQTGTITLPDIESHDDDWTPVTFDNPSMTSFPFFGGNYAKVNVSSNGLLDFGPTGIASGANLDIPSTAITVPIIAALWDDLNPARGAATTGKVYCKKEANRMIIEYDTVMTANTSYSYTYTFQVHLYADGRIQIRYRDMPTTVGSLTSATIGIQNGGGTRYRKLLFNGAPTTGVPADNKMVEFSPVTEFFSLSPLTGTVAAHGTAALTGTFRAVNPQAPASFDAGLHVANANFSFTGGNPAATAQAVVNVTVTTPTVSTLRLNRTFVLPGASASLAVTARDSLGVKTVEFFDGLTSLGTVAGVAGTTDHDYGLTLSPVLRGRHALKAKVTNNKGGVTWTAEAVLMASDDDGDGVSDDWERAYFGTLSHDFQGPDANLDLDEDGLTDLEEYDQGTLPNNIDTDGDGLLDGYEVNSSDTDPLVSGHYDSDGDGIPDDVELTNGLNPNNAADAWQDRDNDGTSNFIEYVFGTNISVANAQLSTAVKNADQDGDGLTTAQEITLHLNPLQADTDDDGMNDGWENAYSSYGFDPKVTNRFHTNPDLRPGGDFDHDGLTNLQEAIMNTNPTLVDTDGDGVSDGDEYNNGTNPSNPGSSTPSGNGVTDVSITYGDHSNSHSEKYTLTVTPVDGDDGGYGSRVFHNANYGKTEVLPLKLPRGAHFKLQLTYYQTDPKYTGDPKPDYDYTLEVPGVSTADDLLIVKDPGGILGVHDESTSFFAQGKQVDLYVMSFATETVATIPTDRKRKKLGVAERVMVNVTPTSAGALSWSLQNSVDAKVSPTTGYSNIKFTAETRQRTPSLRASFASGETHDIDWTVVEPSGETAEKVSDYTFPAGQQGVAMHIEITTLPIDVSFENVEMLETDYGTSNVTGYFQQFYVDPSAPGYNPTQDPLKHDPGTSWVALTNGASVIHPGAGQNMWWDEAGFFGWSRKPWGPGSYQWNIGLWWRTIDEGVTNPASIGAFLLNRAQLHQMVDAQGKSVETKLGQTATRTP